MKRKLPSDRFMEHLTFAFRIGTVYESLKVNLQQKSSSDILSLQILKNERLIKINYIANLSGAHNCSRKETVFNSFLHNTLFLLVSGTRFDPDDKEAHEFTRLVERVTESLQGPVILFNFFPWLKHYAPLWLRRKWGLEKLLNLTKKTNDITKVR